MQLRIGLDFRGVIVRSASDSSMEDTALQDPATVVDDDPLPGAIKGVSRLVDASDGNCWIVSKAGLRMQARSLRWLDSTAFYSRTGLCKDHVRFCVSRQDKAAICTELGITHFMDDRIHVMQILRAVVPHLFLFSAVDEGKLAPSWATHVSSWTEATDLILRTIEEG